MEKFCTSRWFMILLVLSVGVVLSIHLVIDAMDWIWYTTLAGLLLMGIYFGYQFYRIAQTSMRKKAMGILIDEEDGDVYPAPAPQRRVDGLGRRQLNSLGLGV